MGITQLDEKIVAHHTTWNYIKSKKANKKFDFKVFTETVPNELKGIGHVAMMRRSGGHCQEPASVAFSVLSLAMHFHGWLSFFITLYYKLPLKQDKDVDITKRLDYSSAIVVLGIVSILRTFAVRVETARFMLSFSSGQDGPLFLDILLTGNCGGCDCFRLSNGELSLKSLNGYRLILGVKVIIRSHEGPDARSDREDMGNMLCGYSVDHEVESGKLYTIFSASNLSQGSRSYENEGSYAVLEPPSFTEPKFVSYTVENVPRSLHQNISVGSSAQQEIMWENRSGHGFASMGISDPPSWTVSLPSEPSQILQLQEPSQVFEGLPLPDTIEEPHKSNYDYLFRLISALKQEVQIRDTREKEL
ncbi:hypothetical protein F2Q68_00007236, partial [Brassica cretica]